MLSKERKNSQINCFKLHFCIQWCHRRLIPKSYKRATGDFREREISDDCIKKSFCFHTFETTIWLQRTVVTRKVLFTLNLFKQISFVYAQWKVNWHFLCSNDFYQSHQVKSWLNMRGFWANIGQKSTIQRFIFVAGSDCSFCEKNKTTFYKWYREGMPFCNAEVIFELMIFLAHWAACEFFTPWSDN